MKKINIKSIFTKDNVRRVGSFIGTIFLGYCAVVAKADLVSNTNHSESGNCIYYPDYPSAINAIMNSTMFSSDKTAMCQMLLVDSKEDYYRSVMTIANSDMFSSDKKRALKNLNDSFRK